MSGQKLSEQRLAVVLFNLGGPDRLEAVEPFLFNLFNDPVILGLPGLLRWPLARLIARRRAPVAQKIYQHLGGSSPLLANTQAQATALEAVLTKDFDRVRTFIAMRYWHPFADQTAAEVKAFAPDHIVLLPLYPQWSITTSGSSLNDWRRAAAAAGLQTPTTAVCCYPEQDGLISVLAESVASALEQAEKNQVSGYGPPRVLFTAHGLPQKVIDRGDPYQSHCEQTAAAVIEKIKSNWPELTFDARGCYQSRVGPMKWIGPATKDELIRAGQERVPVVLVPTAFVSEHSETLVELDIEYRHLAETAGVPWFKRIATVSDQARFIEGLAQLIRESVAETKMPWPDGGARRCRPEFSGCPCQP
ncbi:Ferrochelatase [uncultured Gammaproteobacteria bacterium]